MVLLLAFWGLLFSGGAVFIQRRFGATFVWIAWAALLAGLTCLKTIAFHRSFPGGAGSVATTIYAMAMFAGIPTATVAVAAIRLGNRQPPPSPARHVTLTLLLYLASLPVALVMGALPDIARMF